MQSGSMLHFTLPQFPSTLKNTQYLKLNMLQIKPFAVKSVGLFYVNVDTRRAKSVLYRNGFESGFLWVPMVPVGCIYGMASVLTALKNVLLSTQD